MPLYIPSINPPLLSWVTTQEGKRFAAQPPLPPPPCRAGPDRRSVWEGGKRKRALVTLKCWGDTNGGQRALVSGRVWGRWRQVTARDDARRGVSIEADIIEGAANKPCQDRAVCSDRNIADPPDEMDAIALLEMMGWLCHTRSPWRSVFLAVIGVK